MDKLVEGKHVFFSFWGELSLQAYLVHAFLLSLPLSFPPLVLIKRDFEGEFAFFLDWTSNSDNDCIPEEDN